MLIQPLERAGYERAVSAGRVHLGERAFAAAWAQGRAMTAEQALAAQGQKPTPALTTTVTPAPTYPAGLTAREAEVLRLVAGGLTDVQVAEKLVLSPSTVHDGFTLVGPHLFALPVGVGLSRTPAIDR